MAIAHYHPVSGSAGGVDRTGVSAHRADEQTSMEHLSCNDTSDPQATRGVMAPAHISTASEYDQAAGEGAVALHQCHTLRRPL